MDSIIGIIIKIKIKIGRLRIVLLFCKIIIIRIKIFNRKVYLM